MKHKNICHEKECNEYQIIEWNGGFIDKWFCDKHKKK